MSGNDPVKQRLEDGSTLTVPTVYEKSGLICDLLGANEKPVNFVIDKNGVVRYAGLNLEGWRAAVDQLFTEKYDPGFQVKIRPDIEAMAKAAAEEDSNNNKKKKKQKTETVSYEKVDPLIGKQAPELFVSEWFTDEPDLRKIKLVMLEFWATWSSTCRRSIPNLNKLAFEHSDDIKMIGISDEETFKIKMFMRETKIRYQVGTEPTGKVKRALKINSIPHAVIVNRDWNIVWKGNPLDFTEKQLAKLLADKSSDNRFRWTGS